MHALLPKWVTGGALVLALGLAAGLVSCGASIASEPDGGGSVETAASPEDVEATCHATCEHDQRCQGTVSATCVLDCVVRAGPPASLSRQALALYAECVRDPACRNDDDCEASAGARDPAIPPEVSACGAFQRTCPTEGDGSSCLRIRFLTPVVRARAKPCYAGTCTNTGRFMDCLQTAYGG